MGGGAGRRGNGRDARSRGAPGQYVHPGTELQKANDLLEKSFHANPNGASAQLVFVAPHGQKVTASGYETLINEFVTKAADSP